MKQPINNNFSNPRFFSITIISLLALIIIGYLSFNLWRNVYPSCVAGKINDKVISCEQFETHLKRHTILTQMQYGKLFEQFKTLLRLKEQTWEKIVLLNEAKKQGISVANENVVKAIAQYDMFFRNGAFDYAAYKYFVRQSLGSSITDFEESIRESLTLEELYKYTTRDVTVTDAEILAQAKKEYDQIAFSYISIPTVKLDKAPEIDDATLKTYFEQHQNDFKKFPSIQIEYVELDFPADGGIQKQVEMKYKAKAIVDNYNKLKDLNLAAQALKFKSQTSKFFNLTDIDETLAKWPLPLLNEIFQMNTGKILEPFKIDDKGYVIVKLLQRAPAHIPLFAEAKDDVRQAMEAQQTKTLTHNKAQTIFEQLKAVNSIEQFTQIAKTLNLEIKTSESVSKQQALLTLNLTDADAAPIINAKDKNILLAPLSNKQESSILFITGLKSMNPDEFTKNKTQLSKTTLEQKKEKVFEDFRQQLLDQTIIDY